MRTSRTYLCQTCDSRVSTESGPEKCAHCGASTWIFVGAKRQAPYRYLYNVNGRETLCQEEALELVSRLKKLCKNRFITFSTMELHSGNVIATMDQKTMQQDPYTVRYTNDLCSVMHEKMHDMLLEEYLK